MAPAPAPEEEASSPLMEWKTFGDDEVRRGVVTLDSV